MRKKIVFLDMDNVLVDFHSNPKLKIPYDYFDHENMYKKYYFRDLLPFPGAVEAALTLLSNPDLDVYILTQPVAGHPNTYADKAEWVKMWIPELEGKLIMTQNKLLNKGDYLIDDSLKWSAFEGKFIHFNFHRDTSLEWADTLEKVI